MRNRMMRALPVAALLTASLATPAMAAVINGTSGPDVLVGTDQSDTIRGYGGNDVLRGKGRADDLYGGAGADRIYGGVELRPDVLYGRSGNDKIFVRGNDTVYAGRGNDVIKPYKPSWGMVPVHIDCGPGYDRVIGINPWLVSLMKGHSCEVIDD